LIYRILADLTLLTHLAFIVFVVGGGFLVLRWRRLIWLHVPCAVWGALIEFGGWVCPLTPLENRFRAMAGLPVYSVSFVERYVLPVIYPSRLTREVQLVLGVLVVVINLVAYGLVVRGRRSKIPDSEEAN
jgi:hypothetical protein